MPSAVKIACRPAASATPTPIPAAEASSPISSASSSTLPRTWRRVAPTMRSRPNSFVRWATVIDSELKIVNAPTSTATPAKASRTVRRMSTNSSSESKAKRSSSAAPRISAFGTALASDARRSERFSAPTRMRS